MSGAARCDDIIRLIDEAIGAPAADSALVTADYPGVSLAAPNTLRTSGSKCSSGSVS